MQCSGKLTVYSLHVRSHSIRSNFKVRNQVLSIQRAAYIFQLHFTFTAFTFYTVYSVYSIHSYIVSYGIHQTLHVTYTESQIQIQDTGKRNPYDWDSAKRNSFSQLHLTEVHDVTLPFPPQCHGPFFDTCKVHPKICQGNCLENKRTCFFN